MSNIPIIIEQDPNLLYKFIKIIGKGAFSTVYKGSLRNASSDRTALVAIKQIPVVSSEKENLRKMLLLKNEIISLKLFPENIRLKQVLKWESSFYVLNYLVSVENTI